jgi:hypothetical protein
LGADEYLVPDKRDLARFETFDGHTAISRARQTKPTTGVEVQCDEDNNKWFTIVPGSRYTKGDFKVQTRNACLFGAGGGGDI